MKPFFVYMLRCRDGSYYVGHTDELERRMAEHHDGTYGGHTARKRPVRLVWTAETSTREEALEAELQLKRWTRAKKAALVRGDWAELKRLARGPDRHERAPFDSAPGCAGRYAQGERVEATAGAAPFDSAPGCAGRYAQGERVKATAGAAPFDSAPGCAGGDAGGERTEGSGGGGDANG